LERCYSGGPSKGLPAEFVPKIKRILFALDNATGADNLSQPGFGLHQLSGNLKGSWSIVVSRNWRVTFRFQGENVCDVDFVDYH
jgi:toxin HigB-1